MQVDMNSLSATELAVLYQPPFERWVRSNMVISLDGNYAGEHGSSRELSSVDDLRVLLLLRALSDVVVVGARTAIGEKYDNMRVREDFLAVTQNSPRLCVVSASLAFTGDEGFLQDSPVRPIIVTSRSDDPKWLANLARAHELAEVVICEVALTGAFIIESLRRLGLNQILCEGGPSLMALMAQDNVFDELAVTLAPIVVGKTPVLPPLGQSQSNWHRTLVGVAQEHTFFRFTASPLRTQP